VATRREAAFIDQFDPYMDLMLRERAENPAAFIGAGDAVHPGPAGHTLMAWIILKGLGADPAVSRVEIDSAAPKVKTAEGCTVKNLKVANGVVSFDRQDEALPMPIDPRAEAALELAPILDELSRYELRVTGLSASDYEVKIDGEVVAEINRETLANGWNLTEVEGPITRQSQKVLDLVFEKNDVFFKRWRNVQLVTLPAWAQNATSEAGRTAELAALDEQIEDLEAQLNTARQPRSHHFKVTPAAR